MYYPKHTDSLTLDYTIGTCLILIFLVSTTLNPLSFLYHIQRDSKLSSRLYALLALLDFIVNIYSPLFQAHNFFKETEDLSRKAGIQPKLVQGITHPSAWLSQIVINVIIFVRLSTIKFPFDRVKQKFVWTFLSLEMLHMFGLEFMTIVYYNHWHSEVQLITVPPGESHKVVEDVYTALIVVPIAVIYILGGVSSIYTVFLLTRDTGPSETREQKRKSVRIILTLSIVNWSVPIAIVYTGTSWPRQGSSTVKFVGAYVVVHLIKKIVSTLDPIIILVLSKEMRDYSWEGITGCYQKLCSLVSSNFRRS